MNQLQREGWRVEARRAGGIASVLAAGALSCLPADNLSSYSNGKRPIEVSGGDMLTETEPAPLADEATPRAEPAPLPAVADCGTECNTPTLSLDPSSALGAATPSDAPPSDAPPSDTPPSDRAQASADAGIPTADAAAAAADAGASSCIPGAVVGPDQRCFELVSTLRAWADARTYCRSHGGGWDLTTIHSATQNAWLSSLLGSIANAWVGASDTQSEGAWRWVGDSTAFWNGNGSTGSAVGNAYQNWIVGTNPEPNGADASDCLRLRPGGGWADFQCETAYASICEGPPL